MNTFYAAMDRLEKRLETNRFLFGDYVTDSDIRLYVTLARLDIRYTAQLGETKRPLYTYKNLWGYAKELWVSAPSRYWIWDFLHFRNVYTSGKV